MLSPQVLFVGSLSCPVSLRSCARLLAEILFLPSFRTHPFYLWSFSRQSGQGQLTPVGVPGKIAEAAVQSTAEDPRESPRHAEADVLAVRASVAFTLQAMQQRLGPLLCTPAGSPPASTYLEGFQTWRGRSWWLEVKHGSRLRSSFPRIYHGTEDPSWRSFRVSD